MTIELLVPVAGLPEGPATETSVRDLLNIIDDLQDASLELAINSVNSWVSRLPVVVDDMLATVPAPTVWRADIVQGATLLAGRIFNRRNSPEGVAAFGDQGAIYVQRTDPDVALMLRLGAYARPAVG